MQSIDDDEQKVVISGVLSVLLKLITEYIKDIPVMKLGIHELNEDIRDVKFEVKVMESALTDVGKQVNNHELRISQLEAV